MQINELKAIAKEFGIVGAGGAGFPAYAKMTDQADTVILNCVECEPLLKLHRQLLAAHREEILQMLEEVRVAFGAKEVVIGIKSEYTTTIRAVEEVLGEYPNIRICALKASYPMGDEVVLIYEATGRVIKPGGLPIDEHVVVYNVETMYNLYCAVHEKKPVTEKLVSIVGEVEHPLTIRLPLGATVKQAVALAGRITTDNPVYLMGGPMMGRLGEEHTLITKTTNAIIVLPKEHFLARRMEKNLDIERRRASSACCQCRACTELCSRHMLGHPIEPHLVMRAVGQQDLSDLRIYMNTAYCSGCGICENYACPQGLSPRSIIQQFKSGLRKAGVKVEKLEPASVEWDRELKKLPVHRLAKRLGLAGYDVAAPFVEEGAKVKRVSIPMSQHIGAPALPVVSKGERVVRGQQIGRPAEGLSVGIHASIEGIVEKVSDKEILIKAR
ncbi:MAG: 4Fe-4S dicluster domain-containing protein [Lachnospiraceae bacterium]